MKWWRRHFLGAEVGLAVFMTLAFVVWATMCGEEKIEQALSESVASIYGTLTQVFASMLGFVIAAVAIVLSSANDNRLSFLRQSRYYHTLWDVFRSAMVFLAIASLTALIGLLLSETLPVVSPILYANLFFTLACCFRMGRCIWVLENVMALVTQSKSEDDPSAESSMQGLYST